MNASSTCSSSFFPPSNFVAESDLGAGNSDSISGLLDSGYLFPFPSCDPSGLVGGFPDTFGGSLSLSLGANQPEPEPDPGPEPGILDLDSGLGTTGAIGSLYYIPYSPSIELELSISERDTSI